MTGVVEAAKNFIVAQATGRPGEYTFCASGQVSLYASCYAAMALHYIGQLESLTPQARQAWCQYINSWQDAATGYYLGPELAPGQFTRPDMDVTYARLHLIVHVLPALEVLGGEPAHPLTFARNFADPDTLRDWLSQRNWHQAWLEGNNLLFVGQLLLHLRDQEGYAPAADALDIYFDWLDQQQDPATGLWGTNGFCDAHAALYGGYHQLLVYHAGQRPVPYAKRIIDTVLALQQPDGSFSQTPGGGACEDVDAIDVLVNLVKRTGHRRAEVHRALCQAIPHILRQQAPDGGFVYRWGRSYMQSGVLRTFVPSNQSDIFSTWFRLHTLALINEVVDAPVLAGVSWDFNVSCSMGWHDRSLRIERQPWQPAAQPAQPHTPLKKKLAERGYDWLERLPQSLVMRFFQATLPRYLRALPPDRSLAASLEIEHALNRLGREKAYELAAGLDVPYWWSRGFVYYLTRLPHHGQVLHLGCGDGSMSYTLASQSHATIIAADMDTARLTCAASLFHHQQLQFTDRADRVTELARPQIIVMTDMTANRPAWQHWQNVWLTWPGIEVLAQLSAFPHRWNDLPLSVASGTMKDVAVAEVAPLVPDGWRICEATMVFGAYHARVVAPGLHR